MFGVSKVKILLIVNLDQDETVLVESSAQRRNSAARKYQIPKLKKSKLQET